jgi:mono/diheme cytochrome c family protein
MHRAGLSIVAGTFTVAMAIGWFAQAARAQGTEPRIWSGVYSATQADRGKTVFQSTCTTCHNFDLQGNTGRGPALVGDQFMANWETESVSSLFSRLKTTMPRNNPGSLTEDVYIDLLAYILQANAYPAGSEPLKATSLADIQFLKRDGSGKKGVSNFAMVAVVGCLKQADDRWVLTHTSEPVATAERSSTDTELQDAAAKPLGNDTFRLVSVVAQKPETHSGQKVQAKGLLYRVLDDKRLNVTSLEAIGPSCPQ